MDQEWAAKQKEIQALLGKESTYREAISKLIDFRKELFEQVEVILTGFPREAFSAMPFPKVNGYHNKTLAYSVWHIFRIEDIVAHEMIAGDEQILFRGEHQSKLGTDLITTGNELAGEDLVSFSASLDPLALLEYAREVMEESNRILEQLSYADMKRKFGDEDRKRLEASGCVSTDEHAIWLIDYWCKKDVRGLLKMPFSRHWIMHIEAMRKIRNKL